MMQVKATSTLCRAQIGCQWVGVFVLIFRVTLIIHQKVKGKGMMNFKCRQEDQCSKDKLVSFPGCKLSLSSLDILLLAVTGPVCLHQHLTTIHLSLVHANTQLNVRAHLRWWVHSSAYTFILNNYLLWANSLFLSVPLCLSFPLSSLVSLFHCASALVISRYI